MLENSNNTSDLPVQLDGVFAVVGCDGTGKTTLTADLLAQLRNKGPAKRCYLGLVSGETGDKIKSLPFIGVRLEHNLHNKANRALDMEKKLPGTGTAIIMYLLTLVRMVRLLRIMRLSSRGVQVIADRYPQAEIPGFHYDGPDLTVNRTGNWLVRKLAEREQKLYEWMAEQKPTLVIRLNIDADTAHARKPDHGIAELVDKISAISRLNFNGAQICEIDACNPYPQVLEAALQAISQAHKPPNGSGCSAAHTLADDNGHNERSH
jgi:thymidylate kinase